MEQTQVANLENQGYRLVGNHSAVKVCNWTKEAMTCSDVCYKKQFYNIDSHRCIQASVTVDVCSLKCDFCWRDVNTFSMNVHKPDDPKMIVEGFIQAHTQLLMGYKGNPHTPTMRFAEAMKPKHVALSLTGDACFYPKLPELIEEFHTQGMTTFLVTNGTNPAMIRQLLGHQPTQLYITVGAPDKETYDLILKPVIPRAWENLQQSLDLLSQFKRSVIRLTITKGVNMHNLEGYAELVERGHPLFVEIKGFMSVGHARGRIGVEGMPSHEEVQHFSKQLCTLTGYQFIDEKENSRVVLLMKEDRPDRFLVH